MRRQSFPFFVLSLVIIACKSTPSPANINTESPDKWHMATGKWYSSIEVMGMELPFMLTLDKIGDSMAVVMDIPSQKAINIPLTSDIRGVDSLLLSHSGMQMTIDCRYDASRDEVTGLFAQRVITDSLTLTRDSTILAPLNRPQHPTTFPYEQEDIAVQHPSGHQLAGTLTTPSDRAPIAVAVLVSGSGPNDRNEEILGHKPFLVLSDYLTRKGIAVFRYDDRGIGGSTGDHYLATTSDLATDAGVVIDYFQEQTAFDIVPIGLVGHSEGALIAWEAYAMTEMDFIVSLAGPGMPIKDLMTEQARLTYLSEGVSKQEAEQLASASEEAYDFIRSKKGQPISEFSSEYRQMLERIVDLPGGDKVIGSTSKEVFLNSIVATTLSPWYRHFIAMDPTQAMMNIDCPVLAVNGTSDRQVPIDNLKAIQSALTEGGNKRVYVQSFDDLNHLFQYDPTGLPSNYGSIEQTFSEDVMHYVSDWIYAVAADR